MKEFFGKPRQESKLEEYNENNFRESGTVTADARSEELISLADRQKEIGNNPFMNKYLELERNISGTKEKIAKLETEIASFFDNGNNTEEEKMITAGSIKRLEWLKKNLPNYERDFNDYLLQNLDKLEPLIKEARGNQDKMHSLRNELDAEFGGKERDTTLN